ncbi:MAG: ATP-binding protein [Vulcanimicrobiota bacterium]
MPWIPLLVVMSLAGLSLALGGAPSAPLLAVAVGLAALALEGLAERVQTGHASGAAALYLAAGMTATLGPRAATLILAVSLLVRGLWSSGPPVERVTEALEEAWPCTAALAMLALLTEPRMAMLAALLVYVPLVRLAPRWLGRKESEVTRSLAATRLVAGLASPAFAWLLSSDSPWLGLFWMPMLWAVSQVGWLTEGRYQAHQDLAGVERSHRTEAEVKQLNSRLERVREELHTKVEERTLLEQLSRDFAQAPDLTGTLDLAIDSIARLLPCTSVVFFLVDDQLRPVRWSSPQNDRLARPAVSEPIVEEAWKTRKLLLSQPHHIHGQRLLLGEQSAVALPLANFGVLYVGQTEPVRYSRRELHLLALAADQTIPALLAARRLDELQLAHQSLVKAHSELQASQEELIRTSKLAAVGQLAAGVAHEINSPLGAVLLNLQLARRNLRKGKTDKVDDKLELAEGASQSAKVIIAQLLDYSRPAPDAREPVDVTAVVTNALVLTQAQLHLDGVTIERRLQPVPPVLANAGELQQVVTNLILNARDAVLSDGARAPELWVSTERRGSEVAVIVEDRGPGFSQEVGERMFEPFFTTRPVGQGTGLGLSISHKIVERHGGHLSAESLPQGARFTVRLPAQDSLSRADNRGE